MFENSDIVASVPDRCGANMRTVPALRLVGGALTFAASSTPAPGDWQDAITALLGSVGLRIEHAAPRSAAGLKDVVDWARGEPGVASAPQFAPWQCWSPVAFQQGAAATPPGAAWVASYLFDHGIGNAAQGARFDVLLMSPHPASCQPADDGDWPLPRPALLETMIGAARREGRQRLGIVVHAPSRNALIGRMLRADRAVLREGVATEVVTAEEALVQLLRNPRKWDAIIAMPELRSMVLAMLGEAGDLPGPFPQLWHGRGLRMIGAEQLAGRAAALPLDAPVLIAALILAAVDAGLLQAARQLYRSAAQAWQRGVVTPGREAIAPYATQVTDAEFIALVCKGAAAGGRQVAGWQALGTPGAVAPTASRPASLRLVTPD